MKRIGFCFLVAATLLAPNLIFGQGAFDETKLIPSSATAAIFASPKALLADPSMELLPREVISVLGKKELGFDPCEINKVMVLVDSFTDQRSPPGFAVVLAFDSSQAPSAKMTEYLEKGDLKGKTIYRGAAQEPAIYLPNDKTIVFGMEPFIKKMLSAKGAQSKLISLVQSRKIDTHVSAFVTIEPMRGLINETLPPVEQIPLPFRGFRELPTLVDSLVWKMNFTQTQQANLEIIAIDDASAVKVQETIKEGMEYGRQYALGMVENEMRNSDPDLQAAVEKYGDRVAKFMENNLQPERNGSSLNFKSDSASEVANVATIGVLVGMLLPAVQQVREAARRADSMNNLRQIALACLNHESAFRRFPRNITSKDGKPLLSWRVKILPFLEENALYDQFHLNEPWDSDHNIKLLDKMPKIYMNKNAPSDTKTVFLAFKGEGTVLGSSDKVTFGNITDGSSNTILCVEADGDAAIDWTKPDDLAFDKDALSVGGVGNLRPGGFNVVLCDGSVHFVSDSIDQTLFKWLILRADGNVASITDADR
ncbi:MAG: DUF1559 domain-containing protein [Mariniblastus sp.]